MTRRGAKRLLLFDLDGTLVWSRGGVGRRALDEVFAERYGWTSACDDVDFGGVTDPLIVRQVFANHGRSAEDAAREQAPFLLAYAQRIRALAVSMPSRIFALPGAAELIDRLTARDDLVLGVLTGNIQAGADAKLEASGLGPFYTVGAFGDEAPARNDLLPLALARANAHRPTSWGSLRPADVVVIGDTPRDIGVARAHGARAVAVATGNCDRTSLCAHEPDTLFDDFSDVDAAATALTEGL